MKPISCAVILFCLVLVGQAAPPSDQSINEMMAALQIEKMVTQMLIQMDAAMKTGMEQSVQQSLKGKELTVTQKAAMENFRQKISGTMKEELSFGKLKDVYLQVYRETFTQDEVTAIIAFYSSPAGKAMVEKIPIAMQKAGTLMQARVGPLTQKMEKMQEEFIKDLAKTK
jgi:hypothetical protein